MIVVVRGIIGIYEGRTVNSQRLSLTLRQKITATIRIWITRARVSILRGPGHRSNPIEEPSTTNGDGRHFLQVICCSEIVTRQLLWLQGPAIAVDLYT